MHLGCCLLGFLAIVQKELKQVAVKVGQWDSEENIQVWQFNLKKLEVAIGSATKTRLLRYNWANPDVLDDGEIQTSMRRNKVPPKKMVKMWWTSSTKS